MCSYRMNIKGTIDLSHYEIISNYINIMNNGDLLYIHVDEPNDVNLDIIYTILNSNNFKIHNQGYNGKGIYNINTYKI